MVLSYFGKSFVKISLGDFTIAIDPPGKEFKPARFGADAVLVTTNTPETNGIETVTYGDKSPFVIDGPGEYEIMGVYVRGALSEGKMGKINTVYRITLEDITICHLGRSLAGELSPETREVLGEIDLLLLPTFDSETLSPKLAAKLATVLDPKIVIPLFAFDEKNDSLKEFLKEAGEEKGEILDKATLKRKDFENKEGELLLVKSF